MLQEFLRRGKKKKWADTPESNFREGFSAELGVCSRPVWVSAYSGPTVETLPKDRHGSGGFCGGFLRWSFWSQNPKEEPAEKSAGKSASRKQKIRRRTTPPEIRHPGPRIRRKTYQQIRPSTSKHTPGFSRLRRNALGGVFRAWILGHSLAAFWAWSRLPC